MTREMVESFVSIARLQTVSAAAKSLFVSQSTASHRLQMLEQELGLMLFERQRGIKQMIITEDGKRFLPLALQWLELEDGMRRLQKEPSLGQITIGSMDSINQYLLAGIFRQLHRQLPGLNLRFVSYHSREIYTLLSARQLDIGFAFFPVHYDISAIPVISEPMYMITPPGSPYPAGPISPSALSKKNQIYFAWDNQVAAWDQEWWSERESPCVSVDSCALLTTFLTLPEHWAVCPASVAESLRRQGLAEIRRFSAPPPNRICYMLRRSLPANACREGMEQFIRLFYRLAADSPWFCGGRAAPPQASRERA